MLLRVTRGDGCVLFLVVEMCLTLPSANSLCTPFATAVGQRPFAISYKRMATTLLSRKLRNLCVTFMRAILGAMAVNALVDDPDVEKGLTRGRETSSNRVERVAMWRRC